VGLTPVLLGFGVAILWLVTAGEPKPFPVELQTTTIGTVLWLGIRCLGSVVIAPICEELAFRGFLLRRLQSKIFEAVPFHQFGILPLIVSSVLSACCMATAGLPRPLQVPLTRWSCGIVVVFQMRCWLMRRQMV